MGGVHYRGDWSSTPLTGYWTTHNVVFNGLHNSLPIAVGDGSILGATVCFWTRASGRSSVLEKKRREIITKSAHQPFRPQEHSTEMIIISSSDSWSNKFFEKRKLMSLDGINIISKPQVRQYHIITQPWVPCYTHASTSFRFQIKSKLKHIHTHEHHKLQGER